MKMLTFAWRNALEILRDRLNLLFGIGFPVVLILLLSVIQKNVPPEASLELFRIEQLAPGASVFGLSFMTLFSATLIAKDRGSSLLQRLYTTPLTGVDFILGYTLPILPISVAQTAVCLGGNEFQRRALVLKTCLFAYFLKPCDNAVP